MQHRHRPTRRLITLPRQRGFTLAEVLIAAAVLAFAVVALTQAITAGQAQTYDALHRSRATGLAEAMVDEVLSKPYDDPDGESDLGPDANENERGEFDNADDYHNFNESAGNITDQASNAYPQAYQRFSRSVTISEQTVSIAPFGDRDGLMVQVTVTDQNGGSWTLNRFIPEMSSSDSGDGADDDSDDGDDEADEDFGWGSDDDDEDEGEGEGRGDDDDDDDDDRGRGRGRGGDDDEDDEENDRWDDDDDDRDRGRGRGRGRGHGWGRRW